jgi:hypothetical protein
VDLLLDGVIGAGHVGVVGLGRGVEVGGIVVRDGRAGVSVALTV